MTTAYDTTYVDQTTVIPTGWLNALNDFFFTAFGGQDDGTFTGNVTFPGNLTVTGNAIFNGNTTIGNASSDALTFHPAAWTLSNGVTITGTWANLGAVTTVDINGGTVDGAVIGGASAAAGSFTTLSASTAFNLGLRGQQKSSDRTAVSGATTIFALGTTGASLGASGCLVVVNGYQQGTTTNSFVDLILFVSGVNPEVVKQTNRGSPSARTYTASGGDIQLAMAANTYDVATSVVEQAC